MWRAGPVLIGSYILCYTLVLMLERLIPISFRILGPHDLFTFWMVIDGLLFLLVPIIIEPLRVAVVASAYNETRVRLESGAVTDGVPDEHEAVSAVLAEDDELTVAPDATDHLPASAEVQSEPSVSPKPL